MARKSLFIVWSLLIVLSLSSLVFAQEMWNWNSFTAQYERFKYEITTYSKSYDYGLDEEVVVEEKQTQEIELVKMDEENTQVTLSNTYYVPQSKLSDELSLIGLGLNWLTDGGEWVTEIMMMGLFAYDLELEVGTTVQTFDGSRFRIVEKQTVAGVDGYYCTKSRRMEDSDGNRLDILISEWVIAPNVGWPLLVRVYSDGEVQYVMELVEYSRKD